MFNGAVGMFHRSRARADGAGLGTLDGAQRS